MPTQLADIKVENDFFSLPADFYTALSPSPFPHPYVVGVSQAVTDLLGFDREVAHTPEFAEVFSGNRLLSGSRPLAAVYSGHQFGVWAGQLGDGRAILLGDVAPTASGSDLNRVTPPGKGRLELQLKGAGMTPYSRMGDGRAVLRSSIREFLCSEAMAALGIPTSRALTIVGSTLPVMRESLETAAIVTRVAPTFIRFGSFEHWYYSDQKAHLKSLADYVISRFYPELQDQADPYWALLHEVTKRTAELIAQWQAVGFMHGVMNTDNMSITGLTIDYGPFGFMEAFDVNHICNHSDQQGRYAYRMQPTIGQWNCFALAQALLPLIGDTEAAKEAVADYPTIFENKHASLFAYKLGLTTRLNDDDALLEQLFTLLQNNHVDFTQFFRKLAVVSSASDSNDAPVRDMFINREECDQWVDRYRQRLQREGSVDDARRLAMNRVNPKFVLRNYLAQIAIEKAQHGDFDELAQLQRILENPFDEQPENERYAQLPPDWAKHLEVSCSS